MPKAEPLAQSWWAQRWLAAVEGSAAANGGRLARGRAYARDGRVFEASVRPGGIEARVEGSYLIPYEVGIELAPISDATWARVVEALAGQAAYAASLLAGELPRELEEVVARAGVSLFPQGRDELEQSCTCPDWWGDATMCKHIAAVHYVMAANLDRDPSLLLTLRGRSLDDLIAALRERWAAEVGAPAESSGEPAAGEPDAPAAPAPEEPMFAPLATARFYEAGPALDEFGVTITAPQVEAALLRRLGKPPFSAADEDPIPALTRVYSAVTHRALQAFGRSGERKRKA